MRSKVQKNKRQTSALRFKIKKRSAEHRRKVRKEIKKARKDGIQPRNASKAGHIPNMFPHKMQLIKEHDQIKSLQEQVKSINKNKKKRKDVEEVPDLIEE